MSIRMNKHEEIIFRELMNNKELSVERIKEITKSHSNQSVIIRMKYLTAKLATIGWIITNKGGIGRGRKACYSMEKKF